MNKRLGTAALRLHWRCPSCERELGVDLSQPYDPEKLRCCNYSFGLTSGGKGVFFYRPAPKEQPPYRTQIPSWTEEN